jgi:hypothetical protein
VQNTRNTYGFFLDGYYELRPALTATARLRIYGDKRLAGLELSNGKSPLYYRMGAGDVAAYLPLLFCRCQGAWVIIR